MIRFVVGPDGALVTDLAERLPGRGVWLTADRGVIGNAVARQAFSRAMRRPVAVSPQLVADLELLLARRCAETLGLARRAGSLVAGYEQVAEWLKSGRAGLVVVATDASESQLQRLTRGDSTQRVATGLDSGTIGRALGRESATYAALERSRLADRLARDLDRLAGVAGRLRLAGSTEPTLEPGIDGEGPVADRIPDIAASAAMPAAPTCS